MYRIAPFFLLFLVTGCVTLDDFKKMSPGERARQVCERQESVVVLENERQNLSASIQQSQMDLARGYKVFRQCFPVKVYGRATVTCREHGSQVRCVERRPEYYQTQCVDTPVGISPELERQNIQLWANTLANVEQQLSQAWLSCSKSVESMSAEEAYRYYK